MLLLLLASYSDHGSCLIVRIADRNSHVRAAATRCLAALVEAFPHLQWSTVCAGGVFDCINAVSQHAVSVNVVKVEVDGDSSGAALRIVATLSSGAKTFDIDAPSARNSLLSILSGWWTDGGSRHAGRWWLHPCLHVHVVGLITKGVGWCCVAELTATASRWLVVGASKAPEEAQGVVQV